MCELEVVREKDIRFKLQFTCRQCFRASELTERGLCELVPWGDTAVCYSTRLESLSGSCSFSCICVWKHSEPPPHAALDLEQSGAPRSHTTSFNDLRRKNSCSRRKNAFGLCSFSTQGSRRGSGGWGYALNYASWTKLVLVLFRV